MSAPPVIRVLPDALANQIAAGEVVERPAAALKELVENALDAGARRVTVDLLDGGLRLIRVQDDGCGMCPADAAACIQRHATSKLRSKEELFSLRSFGFRGEALPSIAAVSRFVLSTRQPGDEVGTKVEVEGGAPPRVGACASEPGTQVEVRDLFWNVPARRKFVKRASAELAHCTETLMRLALPRPDVEFILREGERTLLRCPPEAPLEERAALALGREVRGRLRRFQSSVRGIEAEGWAALPDVHAGTARSIWLFINGRAIRDRALQQAVLRAYEERLPEGRYPCAVVFLRLDPQEVDVNVHPAKWEVRLADPKAAFEAVWSGVCQVAQGGPPAELRTVDQNLQGAPAPSEPAPAQSAHRPYVLRPFSPSGVADGGALDQSRLGTFGQGGLRHHPLELRCLGQLRTGELVCEGQDGLTLADPHGLAERVRSRQLLLDAREGRAPAKLLFPLVATLRPAQLRWLKSAASELAFLGFDLEFLDGGSVTVRGGPQALGAVDAPMLSALLVRLADLLAVPAAQRGEEARLEALALCASQLPDGVADCSPAQAQRWLSALDSSDLEACCAHGRPIFVELSNREIAMRFGRVARSRE